MNELEINRIEEMRVYLGDFVDSQQFKKCLSDRFCTIGNSLLDPVSHICFCLIVSYFNSNVCNYLQNFLQNRNIMSNKLNDSLYLCALYTDQNCPLECLQILFDNGAEANAKYGDYPLLHYFLAKNVRSVFIDSLLKNGADVNIKNDVGRTALEHYLCKFKNSRKWISKQILTLLISAGSNYKTINYKKYLIKQEDQDIYLDCISAYEGRNIKPAKK